MILRKKSYFCRIKKKTQKKQQKNMKISLEDYNENRLNPIGIVEFEVLAVLFPALWVIGADGKVDEEEKKFYLGKIQEQQALDASFSEAILNDEISYILDNLAVVYPIFCKPLQDINQNGDFSEPLLDMMLAASRVSYDSWKNNIIHAEKQGLAKYAQSFLKVFLSEDTTKKQISATEKTAMETLLKDINALTVRNIEVLADVA